VNGFFPRLEEPAVRAVLERLIDLADRTPLLERSRPPGFRAREKDLPQFYELAAQDRLVVWRFIEHLRDAGWIRIAGKRLRADQSPWDVHPRLTLVAEAEPAVRAALGRESATTTYTRRWREAVLGAASRFGGDVEPLSRTPIEVPEQGPEQIVERLCGMSHMDPGTLAREASARALWGLSKLLDNRVDAVNAALGRTILREKPLLVNVHVCDESPQEILFVENEVSYILAAATCPRGRALVWSSGFMASAKRLREPGGMTLHATAASTREGVLHLEALLRDGHGARLFFFGDLDYAGMRILRQLREIFPEMAAWEPGYDVLLDQLASGEGHAPEAAEKTGQSDPVTTGCRYADEHLLPAIRTTGRFVDQEAFTWTDLCCTPGPDWREEGPGQSCRDPKMA